VSLTEQSDRLPFGSTLWHWCNWAAWRLIPSLPLLVGHVVWGCLGGAKENLSSLCLVG
jgi:hypothetical protein